MERRPPRRALTDTSYGLGAAVTPTTIASPHSFSFVPSSAFAFSNIPPPDLIVIVAIASTATTGRTTVPVSVPTTARQPIDGIQKHPTAHRSQHHRSRRQDSPQ
mmetsp:Transcript_577/g.1396  ORF Transcript_577/g.1396 Transcript_577/m.1396 type:complete len:104 (-) Transcript_577:556-867(-)